MRRGTFNTGRMPISSHFLPLGATIGTATLRCQRFPTRILEAERALTLHNEVPGRAFQRVLISDHELEPESSKGVQAGEESACKPGSVESSHSSGTPVTGRL